MWTVVLQKEDGEEIEILKPRFTFKYSAYKDESFKLVKYFDDYGDVIFNWMQIKDLIEDLERLKPIENNPQIDEIIKFAKRCEPLTHLVFAGD